MINRIIPLWERRPFYTLGENDQDKPFMEVYLAKPEKANGAAMLIFPGGAYTFLSEKSGAAYGHWLAEEGITAFVVHYRLGAHGYRYKALLANAQRALSIVHSHAENWKIDPHRIGVIGTSAGGHLASLLLTQAGFNDLDECLDGESDIKSISPAFGVLCYSVISLKDPLAHQETRNNFLGEQADDISMQERYSSHLHVSEKTPPCFIWHTIEDQEVAVENSICFADALRAHNVPYELHLYEKGVHALALAIDEGLHWTKDCIRWLKYR